MQTLGVRPSSPHIDKLRFMHEIKIRFMAVLLDCAFLIWLDGQYKR
jgi:hypothetical protein